MKKNLNIELKGYRNVVETTNWVKDQMKEIYKNGFSSVEIQIKYE